MTHDIPWSILRKLLRDADKNGNSIKKIRKAALELFEEIIMEHATEIAKKAVILMNHSERSTVFPEDIKTAETML